MHVCVCGGGGGGGGGGIPFHPSNQLVQASQAALGLPKREQGWGLMGWGLIGWGLMGWG